MSALAEKPMVEHALDLARRGFHVFPLRAGSKEPPLIRAFQDDATRDPKRIRHWWKQWPDANVGISTSRFGRDQALLVADIDTKNGKGGDRTMAALIADGFAFPPTFVQLTPTGGQHHFYVVPTAVRQGVDVFGEGIDVRSAGGYVVAAGSILDGDPTRMYLIGRDADPVPAPAWMIERCGAPRERASNADIPRQGIDAELATQRALDYLAAIEPATQGGRNDAGFKVAAKLRDFGVSQPDTESLMAEHWRCEPPLAAEELAHVVESAFRYAKNQAGVDAVESYFEPVPPEEQAEPTAPAAAQPPKAKRKLTLLRDDPTAKPPALTLVQGLLREQGLSVWAGRPDSGKSTLLQDLAMHVSHGLPWLGRHTTKAAVLYLAFERAEDIQARRNAFYLENELLASDRGAVPFLSADCSGLILSNRETVEMIVAAVSELREVGQAAGLTPGAPVLLVVDTLSRAMGAADENSSADMGAAVLALTEIMTRAKAHVAVAHHLGKTEGKGLRGHSKLEGDTDAVFLLDGAEVVSPKLKGGKSWRLAYEIGAVQVDIDPFGGPVHSTVLRPAVEAVGEWDGVEIPAGPAPLRRGTKTWKAREALRKLTADGNAGPASRQDWLGACPFLKGTNRARDFAVAVEKLRHRRDITEEPSGHFRLAGAPGLGETVH